MSPSLYAGKVAFSTASMTCSCRLSSLSLAACVVTFSVDGVGSTIFTVSGVRPMSASPFATRFVSESTVSVVFHVGATALASSPAGITKGSVSGTVNCICA